MIARDFAPMYDKYCRVHKIETVEERNSVLASSVVEWADQDLALDVIESGITARTLTTEEINEVHRLRLVGDADIRARAGAVLCRMAPHA